MTAGAAVARPPRVVVAGAFGSRPPTHPSPRPLSATPSPSVAVAVFAPAGTATATEGDGVGAGVFPPATRLSR